MLSRTLVFIPGSRPARWGSDGGYVRDMASTRDRLGQAPEAGRGPEIVHDDRAPHARGAKVMTRSALVQLFVGAPFAGFFAIDGAHGIVTGGPIAPAVFGLLALGLAEWFVCRKEGHR